MLLTRAPLSPKTSFDLHVLGMPPAFVLSHNQTLKLSKLDKRLKFTERPYLRNTLCSKYISILLIRIPQLIVKIKLRIVVYVSL